MKASTWLVPLNIHHSLSLRTVAKNSRQLQSISLSLVSLTNSVIAIERSSIELTGTANAILDLLKSEQHKEEAIAAMRSLIFNHLNTCESALKEGDNLTAYSSCIISERLLNQPWFNPDLFSYASFEEMKYASESLSRSQEIMEEIESKLNLEEKGMIDFFVDSLDKLKQMEKEVNPAIQNFVQHLNWSTKYWGLGIPGAGIDISYHSINYLFYDDEYGISININGRDYKGDAKKTSSSSSLCGWTIAEFSKEMRAFYWENLSSKAYEDTTIDEWGKVLSFLSFPSLNIGDKYAPQELVDLSVKPLVPSSFFGSKGWTERNRESCLRAIDTISGIYVAYDNWKSVVDRNDRERKLMIDNTNESFKGRLSIEVSN